jgi:hypothetical protein
MAWGKYQPERADFLINTDWDIRQMRCPQKKQKAAKNYRSKNRL